jgi:hypothetical protein
VPNTATLATLLVNLRAELGQSMSSGQATQIEPAHRVKLQRVQRALWHDFNWPHLRVKRDIAIAAGQRLYDLPADLALEKIERVEVKWSGDWLPVERGISSDDLSAYDSDTDERSDPLLRWDTAENNQIEVWPVPAANSAQTLRITGIRVLADFTADADLCDVDRDLLVLTAAADLAKYKDDAARFETRARALYAKLKGNSTFGGDRTVANFAEQPTRGRWPQPPRIARN